MVFTDSPIFIQVMHVFLLFNDTSTSYNSIIKNYKQPYLTINIIYTVHTYVVGKTCYIVSGCSADTLD